MAKPGILDLSPTQFVLGMKEVDFKTQKFKKFSAKELAAYCDDHVIPIVIGPAKQNFLIDHHHFARACWENKIDSYKVSVLKDLSHLSEAEFWNFMIKNEWVYLHDQFGLGEHPPAALPMDIRGLADDPYRSLVWAVIEQGGITKETIPFFEFKWAAFFRRNLDVKLYVKSDFKSVMPEALKLCKSVEASHLPGFIK